MSKKKAASASAPKAEPKNSKGVSQWTFPKVSLEDAIAIPKAIEEKFAGHVTPAKELAKAVGFRLSNDWRFQDMLRAANQYGLVSGSGATAKVGLQQIGEDLVAPSSSRQRKAALREAFRHVEQFAQVEDFYAGKRLPDDEYFLNTLVREFRIPRERVEVFAHVFKENTWFLHAFDVEPGPVETAPEPDPTPASSRPSSDDRTRVREFLDTCFVMMPFGEWFDRYYQEVYVPAIRDAGFEPKRADELFTTGSVVEQIWEEISKSTVLLADLTNKNPNVFYELGLAHAACKPVVFTAGNLDDVPFDLRHLRVIIYEVREPKWADKLQGNITEYLRNAREEPGKSIPQPFRERLMNGDDSD